MNVREFSYLFLRDWHKTKGLIQPAIAAKLLGVTRGRMSQICEERNLAKYKYDDPSKPLLSLEEVLKIKNEKYNNLSTEAKKRVDEINELWEIEFEKQLELEERYSEQEEEISPSYEEEIDDEIEDYMDHLGKNI